MDEEKVGHTFEDDTERTLSNLLSNPEVIANDAIGGTR